MLETFTIVLAIAALAGAVCALVAALATRRRVDRLPKPFWAGAAPIRGSKLDTRYRYDHMLHAFDWLQPGDRLDLGDGETLEVLLRGAGLPAQPAEQATPAQHRAKAGA